MFDNQRKDSNLLRSQLKPMKEYIITCKLSKVQHTLYYTFLNNELKNDRMSSIFRIISFLTIYRDVHSFTGSVQSTAALFGGNFISTD